MSSFAIFEVEATEPLATSLRVVPLSPFQIFRNLYIDLSWRPSDSGRQLQDSCGTYKWGLNYNCDTQQAKNITLLGPLKCSNCYAALEVNPTLKVETGNTGKPTKLSLTVSATFEANLEVSYDFTDINSSSWKTLYEVRSSNLLNEGFEFTMPLFGSLVSTINDWTLEMGIFPTYKLEGTADFRSNLEGVFQTRRTFEWTDAEVAWSEGSGFSYSLGSVNQSGSTTTPNLVDFTADLTAVLAPCTGLELAFGDETISEVSTCLALSCGRVPLIPLIDRLRRMNMFFPICCVHVIVLHSTAHTDRQTDRTRTDKTGQDRTRGQDWTRQGTTRQDRTRHDRTRQDKTGQDRTRQDQTGQDRTRQDKTGQDRARHDKTGQDTTGQDRTRPDQTRQTDTLDRWMKVFM